MFKRASRPYRTPAIDFGTSAAAVDRERPARPRQIREPLSESGSAFLVQMAGKVSLAETARTYPHVINKLSVFSYQPLQMAKAIDQLLIDDRPERQGFPFDIVLELSKLRELYGRFLGI